MSLMMNFVTGRRKAITLLPVCRQCGFHFRPASLATARFLFRKGIGSCNGSLPTLYSSALVKTSSDRDSSATRKTIKAHLPKHDVTSKHQPSTMMGRERKRDKRQGEREEKKRELIQAFISQSTGHVPAWASNSGSQFGFYQAGDGGYLPMGPLSY